MDVPRSADLPSVCDHASKASSKIKIKRDQNDNRASSRQIVQRARGRLHAAAIEIARSSLIFELLIHEPAAWVNAIEVSSMAEGLADRPFEKSRCRTT